MTTETITRHPVYRPQFKQWGMARAKNKAGDVLDTAIAALKSGCGK